MKRFATTLALLAVCAAPSFALPILSESFSYPDGNLAPNGGWANFSGANTDVQVNAGRATGSGPNANDDHIFFTAQPTTGKTYACFDVIIPTIAGAPKAIYFAALKDAGTANFVSRLYVLPVAGGFTFGISHSSTSATVGVTAWSATSLNYNQRYNIVINYDPIAKSSTLWVNPANESSPSVTNTNAAIAALSTSTFAIRQSASASTLPAVPSYAGTADWGFSIDNLGIGINFDDACDLYHTVPAQRSTWGAVKAIYR
ncbi:MAG: hypothetical protein ABL977_11095 [Candidatus Eisenbacteria bacterium]